MLYLLAGYFPVLEGLKSIYLRSFLGFILAFLVVLITGKPFIQYLKVKKLKCTLITWIQSNNLYSKSELKSRFFYLKKSLANHI